MVTPGEETSSRKAYEKHRKEENGFSLGNGSGNGLLVWNEANTNGCLGEVRYTKGFVYARDAGKLAWHVCWDARNSGREIIAVLVFAADVGGGELPRVASHRSSAG